MAITIDGSANKLEIGANATGSSFLRLYEDTDNGSNYIDVIAPTAVGSNRVLTLPDSTTTIVGTDATQTLTNKTLGSGLVMDVSAITSGTAVVAVTDFTTAANFTGIPSWVKRITVILEGVSLSGSDNIIVQLGDSGGLETTGYLGAAGYSIQSGTTQSANFTTGFGFYVGDAARVVHAIIQIDNVTGNKWVAGSSGGFSNAAAFSNGGGSKTLSATLDRVTVTRTGTNTFDAGTINIMYE